MGKDEKLRTLKSEGRLIGKLAIVVLAVGAGVGCGGVVAPDNGYERVILDPDLGYDQGSEVIYVDLPTRKDSFTDCLHLKATFDDSLKGGIATFFLEQGSTYGPHYNPKFSETCAPLPMTNQVPIDDNGIAEIEATYWRSESEPPSNEYLHPGDSFKFKVTGKDSQGGSPTDAYSPYAVFWKRVRIEYHRLSSVTFDWDKGVTQNLLEGKTPYGSPGNTTLSYYEFSSDYISEGAYIYLDTYPDYYPVPNPYKDPEKFNNIMNFLLNYRENKDYYPIYLIQGDSTDGQYYEPIDEKCLGYTYTSEFLYGGGGEPLVIIIFPTNIDYAYQIVQDELVADFVGVFVAHELCHYMAHVKHCSESKCIMNPAQLGEYWTDPDVILDEFRIASDCSRSLRSYSDMVPGDVVPFGFGPKTNHEENMR